MAPVLEFGRKHDGWGGRQLRWGPGVLEACGRNLVSGGNLGLDGIWGLGEPIVWRGGLPVVV